VRGGDPEPRGTAVDHEGPQGQFGEGARHGPVGPEVPRVRLADPDLRRRARGAGDSPHPGRVRALQARLLRPREVHRRRPPRSRQLPRGVRGRGVQHRRGRDQRLERRGAREDLQGGGGGEAPQRPPRRRGLAVPEEGRWGRKGMKEGTSQMMFNGS